MATIKGLFTQAIVEGMAAAKKISENKDKALAYAALADAMARTGLVVGTNLDEETPTEEVKGKDSLAPEKQKTPAPAAKPKPQPPQPQVENDLESIEEPASAEAELTDEWTEETIELKAAGVAFINTLKEQYDEETLNNCVGQFSEGTMKTLAEITPLNIDGFVSFMEALIAAASEE